MVMLKKLQQYPLQDDERLLLRMIYTDGYTVSKAARMLGLEDKKARKLLKKTLENLRNVLTTFGVSEL